VEPDIRTQDQFYRRGLVVGFTLAEIFLLLIFLLLLTFAGLAFVKDKENSERLEALKQEEAKLAKEIEERNARIAELRERVNDLTAESGEDSSVIDDLFRKLGLARSEAAKAKELAGKLEAAEKDAATLKEKAALTEEMGEIAGKFDKEARSPDDLARAFEQALKQARESEDLREKLNQREKELKEAQELADFTKKVDALAAAAGLGPGGREAALAALKKNVDDIAAMNTGAGGAEQTPAQRMARLEERVKNLNRMLKMAGRGTEHPACWADKDTGRPEYIFRVEMTSRGIVVHDNALPHRAEQEKQLPIGDIVFDQVQSPEQFLSETRALFEWSKNYDWGVEDIPKGCRFFVSVADRTRPDEKELFKGQFKTVQAHFYTYLEESGRGS